MKLNQIIAILNETKSEATKAKSKTYQLAQKPALFNGLSRTYEPVNEEGYVYPSEGEAVQMTYHDLLFRFKNDCKELFNNAATQDWGNMDAVADVVVDGTTILSNVPVSYLLFLEKQLSDIKTFVESIPEQDINEEWYLDDNRGFYVTEARYTTKTKKITKPVVLYEATDKHPAQVTQVTDDVVEGRWRAVKFTGAIPKTTKEQLLNKVRLLREAVIFAREQANSIEVEKKNVAQPLFSYLFGL